MRAESYRSKTLVFTLVFALVSLVVPALALADTGAPTAGKQPAPKPKALQAKAPTSRPVVTTPKVAPAPVPKPTGALPAPAVALPGSEGDDKATREKSAGLPLKLGVPFPCGVKVRVNCGYGPSCSRAHRGHDHFALDFSRRVAGSGRGLAVVAAASGVVTYAGWALGRWRYYGKIVIVDHGVKHRGQPVRTLYAHLRAVTVQVGQRVDRSTELGTLGGSSRGELGRLGAHLHFAVLAGRGSLGQRRSLRPEPLGRHRKLRRGSVLVACERLPLR